MSSVLTISERGTITIPTQIRKQFGSRHVTCSLKNGKVILSPLQTKQEFLAELDGIEADWKKNGGNSWEEVMTESEKLS